MRVYYDPIKEEIKIDSLTTKGIKVDDIESIDKILKTMNKELREKLIDYQKMYDSIKWKEYEEWSEF